MGVVFQFIGLYNLLYLKSELIDLAGFLSADTVQES